MAAGRLFSMARNIVSNLTAARGWTSVLPIHHCCEGGVMNRPTGVTVLAILLFLGTAVLLLFGVLSFVGGAFIGSLIGASAQRAGAGAAGAGLGAAIGAFIGIFFLIGAVLNGVCGYGLWNLKEWGRMLTIVLTAIGIALAVINMAVAMMHFHT